MFETSKICTNKFSVYMLSETYHIVEYFVGENFMHFIIDPTDRAARPYAHAVHLVYTSF